MLSTEDGAADTLHGRATAAGADLTRIRIVSGIPDASGVDQLPRFPIHVTIFADILRKTAARLLIIDPITAYLGADVNSYEDQDVRRALSPLKQLAEESQCAVVLVRHLPKSRNPNAVLAGAGSIAFSGLARTVLYVDHKRNEPEARILAVAKSDLADLPQSLEFRIAERPAVGSHIVWRGRSEFTANALHAAHAHESSDDQVGLTECAA
jgi:RecA-family ATPase